MAARQFRVADYSDPDFPHRREFGVEERAPDGSWRLVLIDWMPVFRGSAAEAQEIADRLSRGEDVSDCQIRSQPTS